MLRPRRFLSLVMVAAAVVGLSVLAPPILSALGGALVRSDSPEVSDIVVVLAGDYTGERIRKGAELVRDGFAPLVLVSGPAGYYGYHECDLAIGYAARQGFPKEWFSCFRHQPDSTDEEARSILPELQRRGVKRYLLVTSNFHTRRAARIFSRYSEGIAFRVIAAPVPNFDPPNWWRQRAGRKIFLMESLKTVSSWFGI